MDKWTEISKTLAMHQIFCLIWVFADTDVKNCYVIGKLRCLIMCYVSLNTFTVLVLSQIVILNFAVTKEFSILYILSANANGLKCV